MTGQQTQLLSNLDTSIGRLLSSPDSAPTERHGIEGAGIYSQENVGNKEKGYSRCWNSWKENILLLLLVVSIGVGIGLGAALRIVIDPEDDRNITFIRFPGELLMRMLKMLILPLIVSSLVSGLATLDSRASGKLGMRAVVYYMSTTVLAIVQGIVLVLTIQPGASQDSSSMNTDTKSLDQNSDAIDAFLDLIRNLFPDNLVIAAFQSTRTVMVKKNSSAGNSTLNFAPTLTMVDNTNFLGIVLFSLILGLVVARMGEKGLPIANFFYSLGEASMVMITMVIWYSPVGIIFLIAAEIIKMPDPIESVRQLSLYVVTVLTGLSVHGFLVLPLIFFVVTRKNPIKYLHGVLQAMATAFGTGSSSATLPVTFHCLEENNHIDKRITRFVLPVGATINMDGTALYEAVAPIFIAQINGIQLSFGQVITISITATLASIGAAGMPQAGLVTMVIVLTAAGLPVDDIGRILAVDWLLDRFRTMINVLGDAFGAGIVAHLSQKELFQMDVLADYEEIESTNM